MPTGIYIRTEEHKRKIGLASIGRKPMLGKHHSDLARMKMSIARKGRKFSEEHRRKLSLALIGNKRSLGKKISEETRMKMSIAQKGHPVTLNTRLAVSKAQKGKTISKEHIEKLKIAISGDKCHLWRGGKQAFTCDCCGKVVLKYKTYTKNTKHTYCGKKCYYKWHSDNWKPTAEMTMKFREKVKDMKGEKHPNWKGGITPVHRKIRKSIEYIKWRKSVFERDNYTCLICGKVGGILNAHHIESFKFNPELRFEINNGKTLCQKCHYLPGLHKKQKEVI